MTTTKDLIRAARAYQEAVNKAYEPFGWQEIIRASNDLQLVASELEK